MPAPLAKGIIITASILIAAGIALYESPQVRQWVDQSRRKIAIAIQQISDEASLGPSRGDEKESRRKIREENVRQKRLELIRKAQESGIAVDLDELARIGEEAEAEEKKILQEEEDRELAERLQAEFDQEDSTQGQSSSSNNLGESHHGAYRSFDELVGANGMLRVDASTTSSSQPNHAALPGLRHRGRGIEGLSYGAAFAAPFGDEDSLLFDQTPKSFDTSDHILPVYIDHKDAKNEIGLSMTQESSSAAEGEGRINRDDIPATGARESSAEVMPTDLASQSFVSTVARSNPFDDNNKAIDSPVQEESSFYSLQDSASDIYAAPSPLPLPLSRLQLGSLSIQTEIPEVADTASDFMSIGTPTPTSERAFITDASQIGSQADDIAILSEVEDTTGYVDAMSDAFSETDFSEISAGAATPNSWTDVESETDGEIGM